MVKINQIKTPVDINDSQFIGWSQSLISRGNRYRESLWQSAAVLLQKVIEQAALNESKNNKATQASVKPIDLAPIFKQSFEMANILSSLNVSNSTLIAAILYPFVDKELISLEQVKSIGAERVVNQLSGVAAMDAIRSIQTDQSNNQDINHIDNLRKMLLVMVDDVRVVLIKLAERLYLLRRAVKSKPGTQIMLAQEISDVYAPLANRLGVGQIKWEMEDLAFRILNNQDYIHIAKKLAEKRGAREDYVAGVLAAIRTALDNLNIKSELEGRAKHIFSIWKKMQRKHVGFEEIYDVRAVRVLVPEISDCYTVLGIVHGLWKHIPKEFDDYVATPKENGYRSLHTAVIGPEGKTLEIQIRTFAMHQESELGVAAHWKYKEGKVASSDGYEAKIAWLRQLLEWQDEVTESADIVEEFRNQVREERIYVFTPQGKLIDLPQGSTALDFAYRVHTEIGHRCKGAKANGRIIPLSQALKTGQKIEILTHKNPAPSRDWLSEHQGYVKSSRARHKIHQWFRHQDKDKNIAAGKLMLEKELVKNSIQINDLLQLAKHFNFNKDDELYASIGVGDKGVHQVINALRQLEPSKDQINRDTVIKKKAQLTKRSASSDILVEGVGNLLTRMAGCCKPIPGDDIAGYVSQGRGIMIHRADCDDLQNSQKTAPEKVLRVDWSQSVNDKYVIDLLVKAYDRKGLLVDVTGIMNDEKVSVTALNTHVNQKRLLVDIHVQIEVSSNDVASRVMAKVEQLPTVISVQRK
jgi:GTP pyrophosphokinase